ncbi:MAG: hypothetical protein V8Q75_02630 [Bacilli bacterium]
MNNKNGMNISITGEELNKSEIIYNNVVKTMEELDMSKDEQIEYLKTRVASLENDSKNKIFISLFILLGLGLNIFGLYLMCSSLYTFGIVFVLSGFLVTTIKLLLVIKKYFQFKNVKFSEIDRLKNILNSRLK